MTHNWRNNNKKKIVKKKSSGLLLVDGLSLSSSLAASGEGGLNLHGRVHVCLLKDYHFWKGLLISGWWRGVVRIVWNSKLGFDSLNKNFRNEKT